MLRKVFKYSILFLFVGCAEQSTKERALKALDDMNAVDYFEEDLQIKFAKAIGHEDILELSKILEKGIDINAQGLKGMRYLFWALAKQKVKSFEWLLKNGANPNITSTSNSKRKITLLRICAIAKNPTYLELAIKYGGDPNAIGKTVKGTIIFDSIMSDRFENVKLLVSNGAEINYKGPNLNTPIMYAASINRYEIVLYLINAGADFKTKDKWGYDLVDSINQFGDAGMEKGSREYKYYLKVVEELKSRDLL